MASFSAGAILATSLRFSPLNFTTLRFTSSSARPVVRPSGRPADSAARPDEPVCSNKASRVKLKRESVYLHLLAGRREFGPRRMQMAPLGASRLYKQQVLKAARGERNACARGLGAGLDGGASTRLEWLQVNFANSTQSHTVFGRQASDTKLASQPASQAARADPPSGVKWLRSHLFLH